MCWAHAPTPCLGSPDLRETVEQAASQRPGMPDRAAPCPNQFEPASGMEPWSGPTSSPWRPSAAQSCGSGRLLLSPLSVQRAASIPASVGMPVPARLSRPPGALEAPSWALRSHTPPPPTPSGFTSYCKMVACLCLFKVSSPGSGTQGSRLAMTPELNYSLGTPGKLPENNTAQSPPQRLI